MTGTKNKICTSIRVSEDILQYVKEHPEIKSLGAWVEKTFKEEFFTVEAKQERLEILLKETEKAKKELEKAKELEEKLGPSEEEIKLVQTEVIDRLKSGAQLPFIFKQLTNTNQISMNFDKFKELVNQGYS